MKVISIAHRRTDILRIQRAAWEKFMPETEFLVAAHFDHQLRIKPDIEVNYHSDSRFHHWPQNFLIAVQQVLDTVDEDVVIVEGDIFPIAPIDMASMFNPGTIRHWSNNPYPGLLFMPKERPDYELLKPLDYVRITEENKSLIPFDIDPDIDIERMKFEIIGGKFFHWNKGDNTHKRNTDADPRNWIKKEFREWLDVGEWKSNEVKFPPITEQAMNAVHAIFKLAGAAVEGRRVKVSRETYERRKMACMVCPFQKQHRCSKCGCYCNAKAALSTEKCPKGRW